MKKLKIKLLCKIALCIFLCCYIIYSYICREANSRYDLNTNNIQGTIINYKTDGDQLTLEVMAREKILVTYTFMSENEKNETIQTLHYGDMCIFYGTISKAQKASNRNLFSYHNYLLSKRIYWVFKADNMQLQYHSSSILYMIKNYVYKRVEKMKNKDYFYTLIVGDSDALDSNVKAKWQRCGISHLIAISGMHIGLLILLLSKMLKFLPDKIRKIMILCFLFTYTFIVGFTPSVVRACMLTVGTFFINKTSKIKQLILILFSFLCYNPYYIYSIGFLFSFIVTFFILLIVPKLKQCENSLAKNFMISWIAFLSGIPIISLSFYETNILSVLINLVMGPIISIIVFPLCLITFILPIIEPLFGLVLYLIEMMISFFDRYFRYIIIIPKMPIYIIVIYYILLYIFLLKKQYKITIWFFIFIIFCSYKNIFNSSYVSTMLDVGQGDSILIELPHNRGNILIDTGGVVSYKKEPWKQKKKTYSITESLLLPYFKSKGIHSLDLLILSHGDYDHMGEAINLVENFKVEKVIFNCGEFNELEQDLIKVLDKKKIPYYSCIKELNIDNNKLHFLNNKDYGNENDNSSVIYTELNNHKFLFMGDAGVEVEEDLIEKYSLQDIDVLKVGHHGSKTSSSKTFIDEVSPKYPIISVGKNNRYGHPNDSVLDNLKNSKIYRTDQDGSIMFKIKNNKLQIETCVP